MTTTRNLTNRTVHMHDKAGNVHMITPGAPFPEWATPQIKTQSLVTRYANRPLDPDVDAEAIAAANAHKPADVERPREITATGFGAPPTRLDTPMPQQANGYRTYEEELAALKEKYRRPTQEEQARAATDMAGLAEAPSAIFDSLLWGPAEAERKRQWEEGARQRSVRGAEDLKTSTEPVFDDQR